MSPNVTIIRLKTTLFVKRRSITERRRKRERERELKLSHLIRTIIDLIEEEEQSWSKLFVSAG